MLLSTVQPYAQFGTWNSSEYFAAPVTFARPSTRLRAGPSMFVSAILNQLVRCDRQVAHPFAGGVINYLGHCRRCPHDADLTNATGTELHHVRIRFINEI